MIWFDFKKILIALCLLACFALQQIQIRHLNEEINRIINCGICTEDTIREQGVVLYYLASENMDSNGAFVIGR